MYFSTFVLVMIVTVGVIAFGASLVARALDALVRSLFKTRPVWVVSRPDSSLFGEFIEAEQADKQPPSGFLSGRVVDGEVTGPRFTSAKTLPVPGKP